MGNDKIAFEERREVAEASELADRIYLMEDGRIVLEGRKEEVLNNERVKGTFLGI